MNTDRSCEAPRGAVPEPVAPAVVPEILDKIQFSVQEEKQVIVHCRFPAPHEEGCLIRIWHSTFLIDQHLGHKSTLIHHENIALFPQWTLVEPVKDHWFTLVFSGLPKGCESFDLKEEIPEEGGFWVKNIKRNTTDIYRVTLI